MIEEHTVDILVARDAIHLFPGTPDLLTSKFHHWAFGSHRLIVFEGVLLDFVALGPETI